MKKIFVKVILSVLVTLTLMLMFVSIASAAETGMPWETPLQKILDSVQGPVAKILGTLAIIATGLGFAFAEDGSWLKKGLFIVFCLSIAFTASSFFLPFLGFAGGVSF